MILFAVTELGLPFPGVKNHIALDARNDAFDAVVVETQVDRHSLQFATNCLSSTKDASRRYTDSVFAKKRGHGRNVFTVISLSKIRLHFFEKLATRARFDLLR